MSVACVYQKKTLNGNMVLSLSCSVKGYDIVPMCVPASVSSHTRMQAIGSTHFPWMETLSIDSCCMMLYFPLVIE